MVVVTLESTTSCELDPSTVNHPLRINSCVNSSSVVQEQSVVSSMMMLQSHRRTPSPDKILFLKVPSSFSPEPAVTTTDTVLENFSSAAEEESRKRPITPESSDDRQISQSNDEVPSVDHRDGCCTIVTTTAVIMEPPLKKARLIILSSPSIPVRRSVRFELQDDLDDDLSFVSTGSSQDDLRAVKTHVRLFDRVDAEDVADLWWSGEEMLEIMTREKSAISVMSYCCEHYTHQVLCLLKMARDSTSMPGRATTESTAPVWVASSPARGLEKDIVQGFKQRKRQVIRKVLESQRVLKFGRHHVTGETAPLELQSRLLSTQYQKWSHPMVRFAQVLAEGDAQVVVDHAAAASASAAAVMEAF